MDERDAELADLRLRNRVLMGMHFIDDDRSFRARLCGALDVGLRSKKTLRDLMLMYDEFLSRRQK